MINPASRNQHAHNQRVERIGAGAWTFLVVAGVLLVFSLLLAGMPPDWLSSITLNPEQLRVLPEPLQANDFWADSLAPVLLAGAVAIASRWLPRRRWSYTLVELLLLVICLRYIAWRCTTLNTAHPFTVACSVLQLLMELLGLAILVFQMLPPVGFDPSHRSREATALEPWAQSHQPSVEIWIPTYNEPTRIVRRAILTCRNLNYNNISIKVLDDGHRPAIAELAGQLGVGYLSRDGNAHRKAGNLNHALQHCQAELIAVFDCDFTPSPQFLRRTVGFFSDPKVAIVQTPQHYFQADFHSSNLGLEQVMPGDLDYFYHFLQVRRDQANAVVCCGTSYLVRRAALSSIGGYFTRCLVEDYQTSTKLITEGWRVKYLNEVLSMGEVPRTFADFLDQRLRWMQGNIQIFFCGEELPIFRKLSWSQLRWYLLPADLLAPLWRITYLIMPLLGLILGFSVIAAPIPEFISYGGPFMVALYTLPNWLSGHYHHQFWMEVYETLFCFPALRRMGKVLRHPFQLYGGIVTNKDIRADHQNFNLRLSWPLLLLLAITATTVVIRYLLPLVGMGSIDGGGFEGESIVLTWSLYNAIVLMVATLACIDRPVSPGADSFPIERIGCLRWQGKEQWGTTKQLSEEGASFQLQEGTHLEAGVEGELQLMEPNLYLPVRIAPGQKGHLSLHFRDLTPETEALLLRLLYSANHPFHAPRLLSSSDALLRWLGTLWRPDQLLRGYR